MKYKFRTTEITVHREDDKSTISELSTRVSIHDEGGGEFVSVSQVNIGEIDINPDEWPMLRQAIDEMIKECQQ